MTRIDRALDALDLDPDVPPAEAREVAARVLRVLDRLDEADGPAARLVAWNSEGVVIGALAGSVAGRLR